jgi:hypothetical protein
MADPVNLRGRPFYEPGVVLARLNVFATGMELP